MIVYRLVDRKTGQERSVHAAPLSMPMRILAIAAFRLGCDAEIIRVDR